MPSNQAGYNNLNIKSECDVMAAYHGEAIDEYQRMKVNASPRSTKKAKGGHHHGANAQKIGKRHASLDVLVPPPPGQPATVVFNAPKQSLPTSTLLPVSLVASQGNLIPHQQHLQYNDMTIKTHRQPSDNH